MVNKNRMKNHDKPIRIQSKKANKLEMPVTLKAWFVLVLRDLSQEQGIARLVRYLLCHLISWNFHCLILVYPRNLNISRSSIVAAVLWNYHWFILGSYCSGFLQFSWEIFVCNRTIDSISRSFTWTKATWQIERILLRIGWYFVTKDNIFFCVPISLFQVSLLYRSR